MASGGKGRLLYLWQGCAGLARRHCLLSQRISKRSVCSRRIRYEISMKRFRLIAILSCLVLSVYAQPDSTRTNVKLSAFADVFYVHHFEKSANEILYPFLYNYNRNRSIHLNHGWIGLKVTSRKVRANAALQAGTYEQDNYALEPDWAKVLLEANLGVALNKRNTLWLDAGVLPSHIGFESAGSLENWTLTRSIIAENSPYYLTGVKLTWAAQPYLEFSLLGVNGWQRIYASGKFLPALGWQVKYHQNKTILNWSSFIGNVEVETTKRVRFFNNLYLQTNFTQKFALIADFDVGVQQHNQNYGAWWGAALITRFQFNRLLSIAGRAEYYYDKQGFVTSPLNVTTGSVSLNLDYRPIPSLMARAEFRSLLGNGIQSDAQSGSYLTFSVQSKVDLLNRSK